MVKRETDWPEPPQTKKTPEQKILSYRIEKDILTMAKKFGINSAIIFIDMISKKLSEIKKNG